MKIGILTFHRCINYGSYWQTRCLVDEMLRRGHEAVVLNHQSRKVNLAEWKCALQPVLPTPVPKTDYPLYRQKVEKFFKAYFSLPFSAPFPLEDPSQMEEFDMVIVGSDEVWNLSHPWYGYYPIFYGEGIRAKRLISYAASFGNYDVSWKPDQAWVNKLYNFDKISVRDENSQAIIKNVLGFEPEMVLDPCLQFPILENKPIDHKPYISVYGHNFSDSFIRDIRKWADYKNLPLISIGYRNNWADEQWLTADPFEFSSFIGGAQAVITNFFHGCVFALVYSKPFVCEPMQYRNHKIVDLMKKIGGERRLIRESLPTQTYNSLLAQPLDESIHKNIAYHHEFSNIWLEHAITHHIPEYHAASV